MSSPLASSNAPALVELLFAKAFWGTQLPLAHYLLQTIDHFYFALTR